MFKLNKKIRKVFIIWLPLALTITLISGLIYLTVQQAIQIGANDPQIQMAEDAATALYQGQYPGEVVPQNKVDLTKSLAPYLIVFDEAGKPIAGNAVLNGKLPNLPPGVFSFTKENTEDRFTWEPQMGVRSALVVTHFTGINSGYVAAGRSIREVEKREDQLFLQVGLGWFASLVLTLIATFMVSELGYLRPVN